ncbi:Crp/Fnr family transcriptional regulator [Pedobacter sp. PLR]|uniref:Crp/Fnr family transcriptional regulator n=1 Tax=Pedobacter sp. PLR TaxID=2994465 RepID=UPI00224792DE|nr:Crp/Fnr family transcriptional regulator [Pedobacter sp. PLR]MCX2451942.1 Crp/Fnr family transcriptional regulator [Pedobacter sp. PLR]
MEKERFFKALSRERNPTHELKTHFNRMLKKEVYPAHSVILGTEEICNKMWFIVKGSAMAYVVKNGKKVPYWFWNENEIMVPIHSFFKQVPLGGYIQVMERSTMLSITYQGVRALIGRFPDFNFLLMDLMEDSHYSAEQRICSLTAIEPSERYELLLKDATFIARKAPVEAIAFYIGVSRKTLNRIRMKR